MITKEQYSKFQEHFYVRESIATYEDLRFTGTYETLKGAEADGSLGRLLEQGDLYEPINNQAGEHLNYVICAVDTDDEVKYVGDMVDVIRFIEEEMHRHI